MKLYHVETQEDYDALMKELDEKGYCWSNYDGVFDTNEWINHKRKTVINVNDNKKELSYSRKRFYQSSYPLEEIITYKAPKKEKSPGIPNWANWVARDENGELWAFENKPFKMIRLGIWVDNECGSERVEETDDTFKHIKWTDDEPTNVKALIKEFSDKSESLRELGEALTRNWEAEHGKPSVAEYNQWQITQAKAHGYDELPELSNPDIINEPSHYKGRHGLEAIEVVRNFGNDDMVAGFYWGNAIKYMTRYRNKNGLEDLKKARKNLDWLIEHTEAIE